jgi:hypothetical protein
MEEMKRKISGKLEENGKVSPSIYVEQIRCLEEEEEEDDEKNKRKYS